MPSLVSTVVRSNCYCYNTGLFPICRAMATVPHSVPDCMPSTSAMVLTLEEEDVEGATLEEPLDGKTVPQLRWWLLCHGIEVPSSESKAALIQRY